MIENKTNTPTIVVIKGDGIGRTKNEVLGVTDSAIKILETAVEKAYNGQRKINWVEALAGDAARETLHPNITDEEIKKLSPEEQRKIYLPQETLDLIEKYKIAIKGPLNTPIGEGFGSINVFLRKYFDLYACIRPVEYFEGAPSPNIHASSVDMIIFRENTEDVYRGIEFEAGSEKQRKLQKFLIEELNADLDPSRDYGIGIKPISAEGTKRLVRRAIQYSIDHELSTVTIVHKGNIQKYTEGAFMKWAYEIAKEEFGDKVIAEKDLVNWEIPKGKILLNDRIADAMFQYIQQTPQNFKVLVCPNLNGDYFSDATAALIGGLGIAPGANIGDKYALFEATHGTAPTLAPDKANPSSVALSAAMLLKYIGWDEASDLVQKGIKKAIFEGSKAVIKKEKQIPLTGDLVKDYPGHTVKDRIPCSEYVRRVIEYIRE